nr:psbp domain-containing protein 7, chloroplastic [Quercus suber]
MTKSNGDSKGSVEEVKTRPGRSPAEQFAPLATTFRRRLLVGVGSASLVAIVVALRQMKDLVKFIYPAKWVGDQTLLYRAVEKTEFERALDPPPISTAQSNNRRRSISEPVVAFGPPGTSGELNVSVIVSTVSKDFSIEAFGEPKEVGEAVVRTITGSSKRPDVKGTLIESILREDPTKNVKYYELEFRVESPSFRRHNVAVCCSSGGRLFTLNAQAPESAWPEVKSDFQTIAHSFSLTS